MAKSQAYFDFCDDRKYICNAELGYVHDVDIKIESDDKQIDIRLSWDQANELVKQIKEAYN